MSPLDYLLVLLLVGTVVGGVAGWLLRRIERLGRAQQALEHKLDQSLETLDAIISGAGGMDRRAGRLEQRLLELQRRIEDLEEARQTTRPYDEAIRLVRQGAAAERLVEELGLTRSEADLLIMLHAKQGQGAAPSPSRQG